MRSWLQGSCKTLLFVQLFFHLPFGFLITSVLKPAIMRGTGNDEVFEPTISILGIVPDSPQTTCVSVEWVRI